MKMKTAESLSMDQQRERFLSSLLKHPSTVAGARDRLRRKGLDEDAAEALVKEALDAALLDDALYARLFAEGHDSCPAPKRFSTPGRGVGWRSKSSWRGCTAGGSAPPR